MKEYRENFNLENEINILIDFVNQNPQFESIVKTKG